MLTRTRGLEPVGNGGASGIVNQLAVFPDVRVAASASVGQLRRRQNGDFSRR